MTADELPVAKVKAVFRGAGKAFLSHSAGCATYLALPQLTDYKAQWTKMVKVFVKMKIYM